MTDNINAALAERELLNDEFKSIQKLLQDEDNELPEYERKRALIRMGALLNSMEWLDSLVINDLTGTSLNNYYSEDRENEPA